MRFALRISTSLGERERRKERKKKRSNCRLLSQRKGERKEERDGEEGRPERPAEDRKEERRSRTIRSFSTSSSVDARMQREKEAFLGLHADRPRKKHSFFLSFFLRVSVLSFCPSSFWSPRFLPCTRAFSVQRRRQEEEEEVDGSFSSSRLSGLWEKEEELKKKKNKKKQTQKAGSPGPCPAYNQSETLLCLSIRNPTPFSSLLSLSPPFYLFSAMMLSSFLVLPEAVGQASRGCSSRSFYFCLQMGSN